MFKVFAALWFSLLPFSGVQFKEPVVVTNVTECSENHLLLGQTDHERIMLCPNNIRSSNTDIDTVVNHEIIHVIHYNLGLSNDETILPEPWFTDLVREYLTPEEVLFVLSSENYREYPNQELEARVLSKLPRSFIMVMLIASENYGSDISVTD